MSASTQRTALVIGASTSIGRATARLLAAQGFRVLGTSRKPDHIPADRRLSGVEYLELDLGDPVSITRCAEQAGPVDVLVNNAGESQIGALEDLPVASIERILRVNTVAPVQLVPGTAAGHALARLRPCRHGGFHAGELPAAAALGLRGLEARPARFRDGRAP